MKIISITGTKGKTTITRGLSYLINKLGITTLRVDTDGHYINEKQKSTLRDSADFFHLVPTVCPGKFLWEMKKFHPNFTAILETAIGSSNLPGLGYGYHNIGIFSNVFEDHLGATKRLKKRSDIAKAKRFIFSEVSKYGYLIFNADDKLVCSQLKFIPKRFIGTLIPVGFNFKYFPLKSHLDSGGMAISKKDDYLILKTKTTIKKILNLKNIRWTFEGNYLPSIYNLMFIIGGIYAHQDKRIPKNLTALLEKYTLDEQGGRLTLFENKKGVKIILDFAHEKYSLREIGKLAKKITTKGKAVGVLRLSPDRTDEMIINTGEFIAQNYDYLLIYDKIDGVNKKTHKGSGNIPSRKIGEVSSLFLKGILRSKKRGVAERIILEKSAIEKASKIVTPGDVVVVISGENHKKTIGYIKKYFEANLAK
ncbi:MAG: Mur ligase family protein [Candidatus Moraniibacteriota bacterium]